MMLKASDKYEAAMIDVDEKYLDGDDVQEATGAEVRSVKASKQASARITPTQAATLMLGLSSRVDALPRIYDGPRYEREYRLADITVWPDYDVVILGEHAGVVREHFGQTFRAASVCNRPTMMAPSALCDHIIGDYVRFMKVYPHVPRLVLGHPTCDPMNKASHRTRADKIASGTAWNLVRDSVDIIHFGQNSAVEQPPTDLEYVIGRPQIVTSFAKQGSSLDKTWWLFTRPENPLPELPAMQPVTPEPYVSTISNADRDQAMVAKSITAPAMARSLYEHWNPARLRGRPATRAEHQRAIMVAWHNFTMYAATYAPREPLPPAIMVMAVCLSGHPRAARRPTYRMSSLCRWLVCLRYQWRWLEWLHCRHLHLLSLQNGSFGCRRKQLRGAAHAT